MLSHCSNCALFGSPKGACGGTSSGKPCQDYESEAPQYEVYWFDESIGSERIAEFHSLAAADKFRNSLPQYMMAH